MPVPILPKKAQHRVSFLPPVHGIQSGGISIMTKIPGSLALAGFVALTFSLSMRVTSVSASEARNGQLHVTKECSANQGLAGQFCTITSSNLAEIKVGSKVIYDQPAGIPTGLLDSNVVLDAGGGNRAVGRCTLDLANGLGLCTFSDGTGTFAGFQARVDVSPPPPTDGVNWHWNGTYSFKALPER
jgi:hypothetical protein